MNKLIGIKEAAGILQVDTETLRRWDRNGVLPATAKIGKRKDRRYSEEDLQAFLKYQQK